MICLEALNPPPLRQRRLLKNLKFRNGNHETASPLANI